MSGFVSAIRILRERERCRDSFSSFCETTVFKRLPNRVPARHHEVVCQHIQDLADDTEGGILIILMPPGGAKTMLAGRALPAWALGRAPNTEIVMVTNAMPLAEKNGRAIREIVSSIGYRHIFDATLSAASSSASSFLTTNGGDFFGVGAAGAALGRRGNWVIIDDPISGFEEAQSSSQMAKLHDAFEANILTRLVPGAKVVLICQRLARNDLAGYLIDRAGRVVGGRKTTVLRLPMLCDDPANDPLGRAEGAPLWPEYWTPGMIIDAQADDFKWKTLYQQSPPSDDGVWADAQDVHLTTMPRYNEVMESGEWRTYVGCDVAYSVNKGDFTVFAVIAFHKRTGAMHLVDLYRKQVDNATSATALLELLRRWKPTWAGIDNDLGSKGFVSHLRTLASGSGVGIGMLEVVPMRGKNKEARNSALKAKIKSGQLHVDRGAPWAAFVMKEIRTFPNAPGDGVDDIIDALGLIAGKTTMMMRAFQAEDVQREVKIMGVNVSLTDLGGELGEHKGGFRPRI
jgi:predicted phage terminase large subunit-like protein